MTDNSITRHMKAILVITTAVLLSCQIVFARLGESLTEARNRYGYERSSAGSNGPNTPYIATFEKENLRIQITFAEYGPGDTKALEILYTRTDTNKWTDNEVTYLFSVNSQGFEWGEQSNQVGMFTVKRSDGGRAVFIHHKQSLKMTSGEAIKSKPVIPAKLRDF